MPLKIKKSSLYGKEERFSTNYLSCHFPFRDSGLGAPSSSFELNVLGWSTYTSLLEQHRDSLTLVKTGAGLPEGRRAKSLTSLLILLKL